LRSLKAARKSVTRFASYSPGILGVRWVLSEATIRFGPQVSERLRPDEIKAYLQGLVAKL
jgi:hypothetical protein